MRSSYSARIFELVVSATAWIAGPVIFGTFLGKWLDKKYGSEPWLFLATVGACFIVSMIGLVQMAIKELRLISDEEKSSKTDSDPQSPSVIPGKNNTPK